MAVAGIGTNWTSVRKTKEDEANANADLVAFLTCEPNGIVAAVHPKAMPDDSLQIVARGERKDGP